MVRGQLTCLFAEPPHNRRELECRFELVGVHVCQSVDHVSTCNHCHCDTWRGSAQHCSLHASRITLRKAPTCTSRQESEANAAMNGLARQQGIRHWTLFRR
eukprot:366278-Chlamydomonas_euryale.AAC.46